MDQIQSLNNLVEDLQSRLAFQEDALQTMSEQLAKQAQEMDVHKKLIAALGGKLKDLHSHLESLEESPGNERPPHY